MSDDILDSAKRREGGIPRRSHGVVEGEAAGRRPRATHNLCLKLFPKTGPGALTCDARQALLRVWSTDCLLPGCLIRKSTRPLGWGIKNFRKIFRRRTHTICYLIIYCDICATYIYYNPSNIQKCCVNWDIYKLLDFELIMLSITVFLSRIWANKREHFLSIEILFFKPLIIY